MSNPIGRAWTKYRRLEGAQRELATLALTLAFSLFFLPVIIWFAGKYFLGDYLRAPTGGQTGGPFSLWVDFLGGLVSGSLGYWTVLLGPYVLLLCMRLGSAFVKR